MCMTSSCLTDIAISVGNTSPGLQRCYPVCHLTYTDDRCTVSTELCSWGINTVSGSWILTSSRTHVTVQDPGLCVLRVNSPNCYFVQTNKIWTLSGTDGNECSRTAEIALFIYIYIYILCICIYICVCVCVCVCMCVCAVVQHICYPVVKRRHTLITSPWDKVPYVL